ncbi:MAG: helix-turn-helix transcriptional regulator [Bacillota bacterium]
MVLAVLARGPAYGYDLTQVLETESEGALAVKEGTLYPILYRFEALGFVEPHWDVPDRGVPRKYYRITVEGRRELEERMVEWRQVAKAVESLMGRAQH